jgi:transposase
MKQYPADFRDRLLRALDAGLARAEAARTFGVSERTMRRWQQRRRELGMVAAMPRRGRQRHIGAATEPAPRDQVRAQPDATLVEHCAHWAATQGGAVSAATMSRALRRLGLPLKKVPDRRRARRGAAAGVARGDRRGRPATLRLSRRNGDADDLDPAAGACPTGRTRHRPRAAQALARIP